MYEDDNDLMISQDTYFGLIAEVEELRAENRDLINQVETYREAYEFRKNMEQMQEYVQTSFDKSLSQYAYGAGQAAARPSQNYQAQQGYSAPLGVFTTNNTKIKGWGESS